MIFEISIILIIAFFYYLSEESLLAILENEFLKISTTFSLFQFKRFLDERTQSTCTTQESRLQRENMSIMTQISYRRWQQLRRLISLFCKFIIF